MWIFKATFPHPCDRSKRDSWTRQFWGKRSGIVLLYSEGELWQQSTESWVHVLAGGGARLGFEGKTAPWPFSVCQSMSRGQETRNFAAKMGTVEEIINNVNSYIFFTLSHKWSITFWDPDTSLYGNKWEQKDTGNNGNRSHLFASVTLLFLLVLDDVCVTSSICFWFLGPGSLCFCGTVLLLFNIHVASSAPCSVLTFHCSHHVISRELLHVASCFTFPLLSSAGGRCVVCMHWAPLWSCLLPHPLQTAWTTSCLQILDQDTYFDLANVFFLLVAADFIWTWKPRSRDFTACGITALKGSGK